MTFYAIAKMPTHPRSILLKRRSGRAAPR